MQHAEIDCFVLIRKCGGPLTLGPEISQLGMLRHREASRNGALLLQVERLGTRYPLVGDRIDVPVNSVVDDSAGEVVAQVLMIELLASTGTSSQTLQSRVTDSGVVQNDNVLAPSAAFDGQPYDLASVLEETGQSIELATVSVFFATDRTPTQPLESAPIEAGDYVVVARPVDASGEVSLTSAPLAFRILTEGSISPLAAPGDAGSTTDALNEESADDIAVDSLFSDGDQLLTTQSLIDLYNVVPTNRDQTGLSFCSELTIEVKTDSARYQTDFDDAADVTLFDIINDDDQAGLRPLIDNFTLGELSTDNDFHFESASEGQAFQRRGQRR